MDFAKVIETAKKPAAVIIAISIIETIIAFIPGIGIYIAGALGLLSFFILTPILLAIAGYHNSLKNGYDLASGAASGAAAGVIASVVNGIISLILAASGASAALIGANAGGAAVGAMSIAVVFIGSIIGVVMLFVEGLVFGVIGAFLTKHLKIKSIPYFF